MKTIIVITEYGISTEMIEHAKKLAEDSTKPFIVVSKSNVTEEDTLPELELPQVELAREYTMQSFEPLPLPELRTKQSWKRPYKYHP